MATKPQDLHDLRARNEARCRRILDTAAPLETHDLAWDEVGDHPVEAAAVDALVYMRDVEGFTDRDLVGLTAHRTTLGDPLLARFLEIWRAEEAGHAAALGAFLDRYGEARSLPVPPRQMPPPAEAPLRERVIARIGGPVGDVVAAAHMVWGAINELLTLNGYRLLADRCGHPVLAALLTRIAAQEARHYSFYLLQAEWRLTASWPARAVIPRVLDASWTPVGVGEGYKSSEEFARLLHYLVGDGRGARTIERMDRRIAALPGLERLRVYREAAVAAGRAVDPPVDTSPPRSLALPPPDARVSAARSTAPE